MYLTNSNFDIMLDLLSKEKQLVMDTKLVSLGQEIVLYTLILHASVIAILTISVFRSTFMSYKTAKRLANIPIILIVISYIIGFTLITITVPSLILGLLIVLYVTIASTVLYVKHKEWGLGMGTILIIPLAIYMISPTIPLAVEIEMIANQIELRQYSSR